MAMFSYPNLGYLVETVFVWQIAGYVIRRKEPSRAQLVCGLVQAVAKHENLDRPQAQRALDDWQPLVGGPSGKIMMEPLVRRMGTARAVESMDSNSQRQ